jgi:CheY-like chemotaxis protein/chemotaxis signal transduction protein
MLTFPLSVNMVDAFMAEVSGQNLLLPLKNILETRLVEETEIASEAGQQVIAFNGSPVPITRLSDIFGIKQKDNNNRILKTILIKGNLETVALIVDEYKGIKKILLKPLEGHLKKIGCINAATILESGDPAFVLNIADIFERIKEMPAKKTDSKLEENPQNVLVVDDSLTTRTLIEGILKGEGYLVQLAKSGEEALEILDKDSFELAVVDIEMPGMNGFELSQKIRQSPKDKDTPIMILSSRASDKDKHKGIEVGTNAYIVKGDFDQETFLETVESLI